MSTPINEYLKKKSYDIFWNLQLSHLYSYENLKKKINHIVKPPLKHLYIKTPCWYRPHFTSPQRYHIYAFYVIAWPAYKDHLCIRTIFCRSLEWSLYTSFTVIWNLQLSHPGTPPLTGSATLSITVNDINDNPPRFAGFCPDPAVVQHDAVLDSQVFIFCPTDDDTDANGPPFQLEFDCNDMFCQDFRFEPTQGQYCRLSMSHYRKIIGELIKSYCTHSWINCGMAKSLARLEMLWIILGVILGPIMPQKTTYVQ